MVTALPDPRDFLPPGRVLQPADLPAPVGPLLARVLADYPQITTVRERKFGPPSWNGHNGEVALDPPTATVCDQVESLLHEAAHAALGHGASNTSSIDAYWDAELAADQLARQLAQQYGVARYFSPRTLARRQQLTTVFRALCYEASAIGGTADVYRLKALLYRWLGHPPVGTGPCRPHVLRERLIRQPEHFVGHDLDVLLVHGWSTPMAGDPLPALTPTQQSHAQWTLLRLLGALADDPPGATVPSPPPLFTMTSLDDVTPRHIWLIRGFTDGRSGHEAFLRLAHRLLLSARCPEFHWSKYAYWPTEHSPPQGAMQDVTGPTIWRFELRDSGQPLQAAATLPWEAEVLLVPDDERASRYDWRGEAALLTYIAGWGVSVAGRQPLPDERHAASFHQWPFWEGLRQVSYLVEQAAKTRELPPGLVSPP